MKRWLMSLAVLGMSLQMAAAGQVPSRQPCDPKTDPGCERTTGHSLKPVADPISTPGAPRVARKPCDPKSDPGCDRTTGRSL